VSAIRLRYGRKAGIVSLRPVERGERVALLDALRGFAILGILLVNMRFYSAPVYLELTGLRWWPGPADRAVEALILFAAQSKFYALFSILFGIGMTIQRQRVEAKGLPFAPFFRRRLGWLLVIGLAHAVLVWYGDILVLYALLGFLLLLARDLQPRAIVIWIVVALVVPLLITGSSVLALEIGGLFPDAATEIDQALAAAEAENVLATERALETYTTGGYGAILAENLRQLGTMYGMSFFFAPHVLAMFLVGLLLGRGRYLEHANEHLPWIRRRLRWLAPSALLGNLVFVVTRQWTHPGVPSPLGWIGQAVFTFAAPALTLVYVGAFVLLWQRSQWRSWLDRLAPVGRMALTNYLAHSLVFTTLFNAYGGGLYGRVHPWQGLLLTLAMFALQIPLSAWWLRRFRFGPVEWLWRRATYGGHILN